MVFEPSLARGLAYYTGTVFEVYAKELDSAITAGGRYDKLIGSYLGGKQEYPAVGISFGLDRLIDVMKQLSDVPMKTETQLLIIPMNETKKDSYAIASQFRAAGINTDIDMMGRNISKNTTIKIPAHNIPAFKPAKVFVESVKTNTEVAV